MMYRSLRPVSRKPALSTTTSFLRSLSSSVAQIDNVEGDVPSVRLPENSGSLINNQWINSGEEFDTIDPSTGRTIKTMQAARETEVRKAVDAARSAFYDENSEWRKLGGYQRSQLLFKLADLMEENIEELAMLETLDNGKPLVESINADLPLSIQCIRYYAGWADKIEGSTLNPSGPLCGSHIQASVEREPVGVVGQIIPWNFPLLMLAWKLGPAMATGCTTVMKIAPQTPLTALRVAELALEAGFPQGALNILTGDDTTGELLSKEQGLDKIAFTGSTNVGRKIMLQAAESNNLQRVTLELGGKSPLIVCSDSDMDTALTAAQVGLFHNQGQCCCASSRIFVHEDRYEEFCAKISEIVSKKPVGCGWQIHDGKDFPMGPLVSETQMNTVQNYIESGVNEGARLLTGGHRMGSSGYFIEPTVFADVKDDMKIAKEEIFGPVMSILKWSNEDELVKRANDSEYGLAASVISNNSTQARALGKKLRAGTVWINCHNVFDATLPFGGYKASGIGRELGKEGLEPYLEKKTVITNLI